MVYGEENGLIQVSCALAISEVSFLVINNNNILEYKVDSGWQWTSKWPRLQTTRTFTPGCSKVKDKVVIAGGFYPGNTYLYPNFDGPTSRPLQSTEVLDLATRKIEYAGNMNTARYGFHLVTIITDNVHKIFALGGSDGSYTFDSVEEFDPEEYTWRRVKATIATTRSYYGAMLLSKKAICTSYPDGYGEYGN